MEAYHLCVLQFVFGLMKAKLQTRMLVTGKYIQWLKHKWHKMLVSLVRSEMEMKGIRQENPEVFIKTVMKKKFKRYVHNS